MSEEETVDIAKELDDLLTKVQPDLQNVIKRSFTNVLLQQSKNGEQVIRDTLEDTSYFAKNTQVNLTALELMKPPTFHMQGVSLDLKSMMLSLRCALGEVNVKGLYSAFNENLYNLVPVLSEGHVVEQAEISHEIDHILKLILLPPNVLNKGQLSNISLSNVTADVSVGLTLDDDSFSYINPGIEFTHDEVLVKLSWPSPQKNGGYEFITTEQLAKHIDDLPLSAAVSLPLFALLRQRLQRQLARALRQTASVSELVGCNPNLLEAYSDMVSKLAANGNKVIDMVLINMRRTLLQTRREVLELPPLHATFMHKIGSTSFIGRLETDAGWVKNLATVNRVCDVSVSRPDPMRTSFSVTVAIKDLQIGYDEYRIKALGASCSGRLAAAFASNELRLAVTVGLARWEPYAQLDDLRVLRLEGMDLHVTGLGPLSGVAKEAAAWTRGAAAAHAAPALAAQLQHELHTALAELPLWDMLHAQ